MFLQQEQDSPLAPDQRHDVGRKRYSLFAAAIAVCSFVIYYLTAFRTITWWENAQSVLAAATLGVSAPPGTLIPTILGWLVLKIPLGLNQAFALNLFAGVVSSVAAVLLWYAATKIVEGGGTQTADSSRSAVTDFAAAGITVAILSLSFSETIWTYSTKFTAYIFTVLVTALILWSLLKWWENADSPNAARWLFVVTLLLGLDFSVHRTNTLLWPAVLIWIVLRKSRTLLSAKSWLAGGCGFFLGLAFHLLLIPIAARKPFLNLADPSNLARFWDYVSLRQLGGGWLINVFPRKADFLGVQLKDYLNVFGSNFLPIHGRLGMLGVLPTVVGLAGIVVLWRRNWRLALGLLILFLFASLGAVVYFNLPENYFRQMDRHYMPSLLVFGAWVAIGLGYLFRFIERSVKNAAPRAATALLAIILLLAYRAGVNYAQIDGSGSYFASDFGRNLLAGLPDKAILFTNGDNDTFPLWYLQVVEKFRPDVTVINLPLLNAPLYVSQLKSREPEIPMMLTDEQIGRLAPLPWGDTTIALSAKCNRMAFEISDDVILPDTINFHLRPTIMGKYILVQDWLVLQMIMNNAWRRPICYAVTVSPQNLSWVKPYLRLEGLAQRLMPLPSPPLNNAILRRNLFERYTYRNFSDKRVWLDDVSRMMALNYFSAFIRLAYSEKESGNDAGYEDTKRRLFAALPVERFEPLPEELKQSLDGLGTRDRAQ